MKTLEELKKTWDGNQNILSASQAYDQTSLEKIFRSRMKKNMNAAMQYFRASFVFQIVVYSLFSHVIVKYWPDIEILGLSIGGALLFAPFTITLMKKFKRMAKIKLTGNTGASMQAYALSHLTSLQSFYHFKKRYELILIPLSSAIGVFLSFKLYVPGGASAHPVGAAITLTITLLFCALAIRSENRKNFQQPLHQLQGILDEFQEAKNLRSE